MNPQAIEAFDALKSALEQATTLTYISAETDAHLSIVTDASNEVVGAVLQQEVDNTIRPLAFFSRRLQPAQTRYSTFGRELLVVYYSIRHFRHLLGGRSSMVYTDHKPLTFALATTSDRYSPREIRQLDYISQFTSDIRYLSGSSNTVADTFSRIQSNQESRFYGAKKLMLYTYHWMTTIAKRKI